MKLILKKKGLSEKALERFSNIYREGITIPMVNNKLGKKIENRRMSLRQGDRPSGTWFCFGIDPLLTFLSKFLKGITVYTQPVQGPVPEDSSGTLPPIETKYSVLGYLDDIKPAITNMMEFCLVDEASHLFENASGCRLHRSAETDKCKFLALSKWRTTLQQQDIPLSYLKLSNHLDFLGVTLFSSYVTTRRRNGEILTEKIKSQINS